MPIFSVGQKPSQKIAESLIYDWRSARRQAAAVDSEALEFIPTARS